MGVEEAKARFVLHECGGDLDRAMDNIMLYNNI
jgi:hypothetical protein